MLNQNGVNYLKDDDVNVESTGYRSQVIVTPEGLTFLAGQVGSDPETKELVSESMYDQTIQCLSNLERLLESAGGDRSDLVQLHVYITSKEEYPAFNEATIDFFGDNPPTRSVVGTTFLAGDASVEVSGIAYLAGHSE